MIPLDCREVAQTNLFRGSKSRNKVSVGEPAEGSLPNDSKVIIHCELVCFKKKQTEWGISC